MQLSFTQCKQLANNYNDLRSVIREMEDTPPWLNELEVYDFQAIQQGGCESGAYMPAVTYYTANKIMAEYGDDVLEYIEDNIGEIPPIGERNSWSGYACKLLSYAVELWVCQFDLTNVDWD